MFDLTRHKQDSRGRKPIRFWLVLIFVAFCSGVGGYGYAAAEEKSAEIGWPQGFSVATANVGGTTYIWLGGWARIISGQLRRPTSVEVTGGPVANVQLVDSGETTFGASTTGPLYDGWSGVGWAKGKRYRNVRALFGMYSSFWHGCALKKSGIRSVHDLQGKRISLGPARRARRTSKGGCCWRRWG